MQPSYIVRTEEYTFNTYVLKSPMTAAQALEIIQSGGVFVGFLFNYQRPCDHTFTYTYNKQELSETPRGSGEIATKIFLDTWNDERLSYAPAKVHINAPLALIQTNLAAKLQAVMEIMGIEFSMPTKK